MIEDAKKKEKFVQRYLEDMHRMIKGNTSKRQGKTHYSDVYDFLLKEGVFYRTDKLTDKETKIANSNIDLLESSEMKQCYINAQRLALHCMHKYRAIEYAEGICIDDIGVPFPTFHGFNLINGKVVDVTWKKDGECVLGEFSKRAYHGVIIPVAIVRNYWNKTGVADSIIEDWKNGYPILKNPWHTTKQENNLCCSE